MSFRYLITSGDSFSECENWYREKNPENRTWPVHLAERWQLQHFSEGLGSQGNGLISRRAMYRIQQTLDICDASEILVGIMWTGRDRFDFYFSDPPVFNKNVDNWMRNPVKILEESVGGWLILNPHWSHEYNAPWYRHYYNETAGQIYTLEHIVNLQNYLKLKNIKYFMTDSFGATIDTIGMQNPDCKWLHRQIDKGPWLPIANQWQWIQDNCPNTEGNNFHPRSWQHEKFVTDMLIPWLENHIS